MVSQFGSCKESNYCICLYSTLQMLTAIEGRLEELFETIETLPADKVDAAEKANL